MAEAIRIVASLYKDGIIAKPKTYDYAFPDLLTFNDAPTPIEPKLFKMFLEHRNRTFQGTFHNSPDYAWWYGYSAMQEDRLRSSIWQRICEEPAKPRRRQPQQHLPQRRPQSRSNRRQAPVP